MENETIRPNEGMKTLSACINKATLQGYTENFEMTETGLKAPSNGHYYQPDQITIVNFYRFEGESDPSDNSILYVVESNDGAKGLIINAYGAYANHKIGEFIKQVEEFNKKIKGENAGIEV
jgi:hypothetical protein